jgi:hypothetical protein
MIKLAELARISRVGIEATSPATAERPSAGRSCRLVEGRADGDRETFRYHEIGKTEQIVCQIRPAVPLMDRHQDCEIAGATLVDPCSQLNFNWLKDNSGNMP